MFLRSMRSLRKTTAMKWDFFVRHYADQNRSKAAIRIIAMLDRSEWMACFIRGPARWADVQPTTR